MSDVSFKNICLIASTTWVLVGAFLLSLGIQLLFGDVLVSDATQTGASVTALVSSFGVSKNIAAYLLTAFALIVGFFKGSFVLKRTVQRQVKRFKSITRPLSLTDLYTVKYALLILFMIGLGISLRYLPFHQDVRGVIDIAVGFALLFGTRHYFSAIKNQH